MKSCSDIKLVLGGKEQVVGSVSFNRKVVLISQDQVANIQLMVERLNKFIDLADTIIETADCSAPMRSQLIRARRDAAETLQEYARLNSG